MPNTAQLSLRPRAIIRALAWTIVGFLLLHALAWTAVFAWDVSSTAYWVKLLDMDREKNLPTLFSTLLLLSCALAFALIAWHSRARQRPAWQWGGLAALFGLLALDETCCVHEQLVEPVRNALHATGLLRPAWVLPYAAGGLLLALAYRPFLLRLPRQTLKGLLLAAALYVLGAIGMEMLGGLNRTWHPTDPLLPSTYVLVGLEEALEMTGTLVCLRTLLLHIQRELDGGGMVVRLGDGTLPRD